MAVCFMKKNYLAVEFLSINNSFKNMKTIKLFLPFTLLIFSFTVSAQEKTTTSEVKKEATNSPSQDSRAQLNLTYEQQTPYREIIKRYAIIARDVRKSALKPEEKKEKLKVVGLQREAEIKALLTPEQYKIHLDLEEYKKARLLDMKKKPAPGSVNAK
jgi:hypothetical protein